MVRAARSLLETAAKASGLAAAVVNVSSVAGISGIGSSIAYAASKGALNTMTQSLARALAPLIRVNTVCPGYIDTPWFTKGRGVEGAAKVRDSWYRRCRYDGPRRRKTSPIGLLPRHGALQQHDRRGGADGCRHAPDHMMRRLTEAAMPGNFLRGPLRSAASAC